MMIFEQKEHKKPQKQIFRG